MNITTKKGDKGRTSLCWGSIVSKDDIRIEVCGTLDELCSFLGLSKALSKEKKFTNAMETIQKELFIIGSEISTLPKFLNRLKTRIDKASVSRLEQKIGELQKQGVCAGKSFCLPGDSLLSASLDIARAVSRRIERKVTTLKNRGGLKNPQVLIYLNRLSDLLFLYARKF